MNNVSIDAVGGLLPLAVSLLYLPRTVRALGWFYGAIFGLSMLVSTHFSFCDSHAVHVAPGVILLRVALWLPRARGRNMEVPAAAIFTLAFIAGFPVDVYLGYVCVAANGTARVGGAGLSDGLIVGPASLALVHLGVYYFCELDERGKVPLGDFLKTHFAVTRPTVGRPASTIAEPS